jgi:hypothetical protein
VKNKLTPVECCSRSATAVRAVVRVRQSRVDRYLVVQNALILFPSAGRDVVQQHLFDL